MPGPVDHESFAGKRVGMEPWKIWISQSEAARGIEDERPWTTSSANLETARQTGPFDPHLYDDDHPDVVEMERQEDIRRCAADLLLVERAREWLLGKGGG
jgi:hypothetical protein